MALAPYFERASLAASQVVERFDPEWFRAQLLTASVGVIFSPEAAVSPEGRHVLDLLVRLLARLYPGLDLYCEERARVPPLQELAKAINPSIELTTHGEPDLGIALGDVATRSRETLYVGTSGWDALISRASPRSLGSSENPLGAGAAACIAAGNVFRRIFGGIPSQLDEDLHFSTFSLSREATPADVPNSGWRLEGDAVLGGVGAIGMAAVWAFERAPMKANMHLVDGEVVELSNLQRYVLAQMSDVGRPKVAVPLPGDNAHPKFQRHQLSWRDFVSESGFRWSWALAAFDNAQSRREVQASLPRWVANAWTQVGDLGVSVHPQFASSGACVACLYLPHGPTLNEDQLVARALGIPERFAEVRNLLHLGTPVPMLLLTDIARALGLPEGVLSAFEGQTMRDLYVHGVCGEAILRAPNSDGGTSDMHVPLAHQSALAGVLLAARLARAATGMGEKETRVARVDLQKPLPMQLDQPALRSFDGRCICEDPDYVMVYNAKYGAVQDAVAQSMTPSDSAAD